MSEIDANKNSNSLDISPEHRKYMAVAGKVLYLLDSKESDPIVKTYIDRLKLAGHVSTVVTLDLGALKRYLDESTRESTPKYQSRGENKEQSYVLSQITKAIAAGASDIHLNLNKSNDKFEVRYRVLGDLDKDPRDVQSSTDGMEILRCIYHSMCDVAAPHFAEHREQNASMRRDILPTSLSGVRIAHTHKLNGHFMVMRLLYKTSAGKSLLDAGFLPMQMIVLDALVSRPTGIITFTGETGSGKSTSLTSLLKHTHQKSNNRANVITVEDPVEFVLDGIHQIPVPDAEDPAQRKKAYQAAIDIILRLDPDFCMISELRDLISIETAMDISLTGHKCFSSFHVIDVINLLFRMSHKGIRKEVIADQNLITGIVNQNLIKTLCPHCSIGYHDFFEKDESHVKARLDLPGIDFSKSRFRGHGCKECNSGYVGRTAIAEVVQTTEEFMRQFINENKPGMRAHLREVGFPSKTEVGILKVSHGLVDIRDVENVLGPIDNNNDNVNFQQFKRKVW